MFIKVNLTNYRILSGTAPLTQQPFHRSEGHQAGSAGQDSPPPPPVDQTNLSAHVRCGLGQPGCTFCSYLQDVVQQRNSGLVGLSFRQSEQRPNFEAVRVPRVRPLRQRQTS